MNIRVDKKRWRFACLNGIFLVLLLICALVFFRISGTLDWVQTAKRWRGDSEMRFTQIACYLPVNDPKTQDDIRVFRDTLDRKLLEASLKAEEGRRLYVDAYSGSARLQVTGQHGSAEVTVIGVGGDFFQFHPLTLLSGGYIAESDLMQDRVVLDETLAWQLFGSSDVAGMSVAIGGKPCYVAGVVRRETDFASRKAYLDGPGLFLSYSAFHDLTKSGITCYEIVLPDMISGFGRELVRDNFDTGFGDLVENSSRYSAKSLFQVVGDYGLRSMRNNGVIYPYWENAVRLTEDILALLLVLMIIFALSPAITGGYFLIEFFISLYRRLKQKIPASYHNFLEQKRERNYAQKGEE